MKLKLPSQLDKFYFQVEQLRKYTGIVEVKKCLKKRTIQQNKYLHVLIALYSIEIGNTLLESKTDLKRECYFMRYQKNNKAYLKSSASLDTKGLTDWIEWVKAYAGMNGIFLPSSEDYHRNWAEIEQEIESHKQYL